MSPLQISPYTVLPALCCWLCVALPHCHATSWPSFRGHGAVGRAPSARLPTTWDVESKVNILWCTPIPGLAHSSPIVWRDVVIVTTAVSREPAPELKVGLYGDIASVSSEPEHQWQVHSLDRDTGRMLWSTTVAAGVPHMRRHPKSTHANATPATDGNHIVAFFGAEGLWCLDFSGNILWRTNPGPLDSGYFRRPSAQWGFGSSPVIHKGRVIVQCDVQGESFIAVYNIDNGSEILRIPRDEVPTWSTPVIHTVGDRDQIIVNGFRHIGAYDLITGKPVWRLRGGGDIPVPTPVISAGIVIVTNAHGKSSPICAIRADAAGEIKLGAGDDDLLWHHRTGGAYMQTPLVVDGLLYVCQDHGVLTCYQADTGDIVYRVRLSDEPTGFTASAVCAGDLLYYASEVGDVYVVMAGRDYRLVARNSMNDTCMATPAIAGDTLYVRTQHHLFAIGDSPDE